VLLWHRSLPNIYTHLLQASAVHVVGEQPLVTWTWPAGDREIPAEPCVPVRAKARGSNDILGSGRILALPADALSQFVATGGPQTTQLPRHRQRSSPPPLQPPPRSQAPRPVDRFPPRLRPHGHRSGATNSSTASRAGDGRPTVTVRCATSLLSGSGTDASSARIVAHLSALSESTSN